LQHQPGCLGCGQLSFAPPQIAQRLLQQRHDKIQQAFSAYFRLASLVNWHEMRVAEGANPTRLGAETVCILWVISQVRRKHLDSHPALQDKVFGLVDLSHTPYA
jgi:hypothetical protein